MDWHGLWDFLSNSIVFLIALGGGAVLSALQNVYALRQKRLIQVAEAQAREAEARASESANQVRALELRREERQMQMMPKTVHPSEYELSQYEDGLQQQQ